MKWVIIPFFIKLPVLALIAIAFRLFGGRELLPGSFTVSHEPNVILCIYLLLFGYFVVYVNKLYEKIDAFLDKGFGDVHAREISQLANQPGAPPIVLEIFNLSVLGTVFLWLLLMLHPDTAKGMLLFIVASSIVFVGPFLPFRSYKIAKYNLIFLLFLAIIMSLVFLVWSPHIFMRNIL